MPKIKMPVNIGTHSNKTKVVVCKNCKGLGLVQVESTTDRNDFDIVKCPVCLGTRVLNRTRTIIYTRI